MGFGVNEFANLMDSTMAAVMGVAVLTAGIGLALGAMGAWRDAPVTAVTIVLAVAGGAFYWYHTSSAPPAAPPAAAPHTSKGSEFERVYSQLGIQPLPSNVERQQQVQSRLAQLSREASYTDAIVGLGQALLDAGYPREAANSLRTFVKRCGSAPEVLPLAYSALEKLNDFSAALEVANELVEALPASGTFRYWRALA
jgi:hypothetical protein